MGTDTTLVDGAADPETTAALVATPPPADPKPAVKAAPAAEDIADEEDDDTPSAPRITIPGGQRDAMKTGRVEWFTGPHEGMALRVHVNPSRRVFGDITSGDGERQDQGVIAVILEHNLTFPETNEPMPTPLTPEAFGELPMDRYAVVCRGVVDAILRGSKLPKS